MINEFKFKEIIITYQRLHRFKVVVLCCGIMYYCVIKIIPIEKEIREKNSPVQLHLFFEVKTDKRRVKCNLDR